METLIICLTIFGTGCLLFAAVCFMGERIWEKLEEIRCGLIDIEAELEELNAKK